MLKPLLIEIGVEELPAVPLLNELKNIEKKLIEKGARVNERNAMGSTALIYAVSFNRLEIAKLLLSNRADTAAKDQRGNTALDYAKLQGAPELIDLLE